MPELTPEHTRRRHPDKRLPRVKPLALTSELCGRHAQAMSSGELIALCRIDGLRLLPFEEYRHWLRAFSHYRMERGAAWFAYFGITAAEPEQITEAVGSATRGRTPTREELAKEIPRLSGRRNVTEKLRQGLPTGMTISWHGNILPPTVPPDNVNSPAGFVPAPPGRAI